MNIVFMMECMVSAHTWVDFCFYHQEAHFSCFSLAQNSWYLGKKGLEGSSHSLIKVLSRHLPGRSEERN
jgi:hypothetical protein